MEQEQRPIHNQEPEPTVKEYEDLEMGDIVLIEGFDDIAPEYNNLRAKVVQIRRGEETSELYVDLEILDGLYKEIAIIITKMAAKRENRFISMPLDIRCFWSRRRC